MNNIYYLLLSIVTVSLNAQVEVTNLSEVLIDEINTTQHITLEVMNNFADSIDLDWEIEFKNTVMSFLEISVSDINNDYAPQVNNSCDLNGITNILPPSESYPMGLHIKLDAVPTTFDKDSILAYFHIYVAEECTGEKLVSLPIRINTGSTSISFQNEKMKFKLYPNPSQDYLFMETDIESSFRIYDLQKKQVLQGNTNSGVIDISTLANGCYVFTMDNQSTLFSKAK